jgi:PAS domain S-box-containing protein
MNLKLKFILTNSYLALLFISLNLGAIVNKFEYISVEQGLSQGNIECIFQDSRGFMWFATYNGLNRFDGYSFKIYNHDPDDIRSISHEHVTYIDEDAEGKLWMSTFGGGVSIYDPEKDRFERIDTLVLDDQQIILRQMSMVVAGPDDNMWVLDENEGVFVFDTGLELVKYYRNDPDDPKSIPQSFYFGLVFDRDGTGWFGVGNGFLCRKPADSDEFQTYTFESRVATGDDGIKSIYYSKTGKIWMGTTSQGAYMFDPVQETFINYRKENDDHYLNGNTVMTFAEDPEGNMLIGVDGGGITAIDKNTLATQTIKYNLGNPEGLNTNAIYYIYFDKTGNLWVGTYSGGINFQSRYKNKFTTYKPNAMDTNSLSYKNTTAFLQDREGYVWIGTDGGGLNLFDPRSGDFKHYRANPDNPQWLQTDVIIHLMQDSDGDIYISSYNHGLTIFNKYEESFRQFVPDENDPASIAGIHPWYTFEDSYGIIWVGMLAVGLDVFDKTTQSFVKHYGSDVNDPATLNSPNIKMIFEDKQRELWIGTEGGGLHKFNRENDNFTRFYYDPNVKNSLNNNDVRAMLEDSKSRFWVGTGNGLCLMDRENLSFSTLTTADGLPGNTIDGILEDQNGFLWLSTDAGISKFNPDSMTFRNYDKSDGLQGNEFNYTASLISSDGRFYFGGKNGFNVFHPGEISDNPFAPSVTITSISILNQPYGSLPVKEKGRKVMKAVTDIKKLKFSHKQNILTFEFAALDYGNPAKNQYKYMLEGFDEEWHSTTSTRRFATYTNLPGGDYVLRIIASNGDGVWNTDGVSIDIQITPPFWKRKIFILFVLIIVIWLVIRFVQGREQRLKEEKELLQKRIDEGLEEVKRQKTEFEEKDKELRNRIESEKQQKWYNEGMVRISQVMSQKKDDLKSLSRGIITELVEYLEVSQGAIYILNDEDANDIHLVLQAAYAPDDERLEGRRIEPGEGQIGASFAEKSVIRLDNLPETYAILNSGLGEAPLKHLSIVPLKLNEIIIGVVELLSFERIPDHRVEFVEKSGETLTSILTALKASDQTQRMLEKQKIQAQEMAAAEEELRQNLEEMQATQEELERMKEIERINTEKRKKAEQEFLEKLQVQNEELKKKQEALEKEEYLFNALLNNANEYIYFKDLESRFIRFSKSMLKLFSVKTPEEVMGKSDFDFFDDEHARPAFDGEQNIIKTEEPIIDLVEKETHKDGSVSWANTSKMPLKDKQGNIVGTWGISKDVTASVEMEMKSEQVRKQLETDEALLDGIIAGLSGKAVLIDEEGFIIKANDAFAGFLSKKLEDLMGQSINKLSNNELNKILDKKLKEARGKQRISWFEEHGNNVRVNYTMIHIEIRDHDKDYYLLMEV